MKGRGTACGAVAAGCVVTLLAGGGPSEKAWLQGSLERPKRASPKATSMTAPVLSMNTAQPSNSCNAPSAMPEPQCSTVMPMKPIRRLFIAIVMGMLDRKIVTRFHNGPRNR